MEVLEKVVEYDRGRKTAKVQIPPLTTRSRSRENKKVAFEEAPIIRKITISDKVSVNMEIELSAVLAATSINKSMRYEHISARMGIVRKLVQHPIAGTDTQIILPCNGVLTTQKEFIDRMTHTAKVYQWNSVTEGTKGSYQSGWNHWKNEFCPKIPTDIYLKNPPPKYWLDQGPHSQSWIEWVFVAFASFLREEKIEPKAISAYLSGVRFFLKCADTDVRPLEKSAYCKDSKTGMAKMFFKENQDANSEDSRKCLPFNVEMLRWLRISHASSPSTKDECLRCALHAAFVMICRGNEFIPISCGEGLYHFFRGRDVRFTIYEEIPLFETVVKNKGEQTERPKLIINSCDAHLYAQRYWRDPASVLVEVLPKVRHAKNDVFGEGSRFSFARARPGENRDFCIATMMFEWAINAKPQEQYPFFGCPREGWAISLSQVERAIKAAATHFFDDKAIIKRYTTRSLRVGGATALMATGASDSYIMKAGRWKSDAFIIYLRANSAQFNIRTSEMCNINVVTSEEISKMFAETHTKTVATQRK